MNEWSNRNRNEQMLYVWNMCVPFFAPPCYRFLDVAALQFLRRTRDVSADVEEMETEMQDSEASRAKQGASPEEAESLQKKKDGEAGKKHDDEKFTMRRLIQSRQLRLPLFIAMFLQVIQQLSGINAVITVFCQSVSQSFSDFVIVT